MLWHWYSFTKNRIHNSNLFLIHATSFQATKIFRHFSTGVHAQQASDNSLTSRIRILYAYLACKLGLFGLAFDVISRDRPNMRSTNLKVLILCEAGRTKDAIDVAKVEFLLKPAVTEKYSTKSKNTPVIRCINGVDLFDGDLFWGFERLYGNDHA